MIKNKLRLAVKLFIVVWALLIVHVVLKVTFNYWQPYVIPNERLQIISDFIDSHIILKGFIDKIFWFIGVLFMILSGLQIWKPKNRYLIIVLVFCGVISFVDDFCPFNKIIDVIITIFTTLILPLIINKKKWLFIIITFALSYVFLFLSLFIEGFTNTDNMPYIVGTFFNIDYYIMLILNYFVFNLIRKGED